MRAEISSENKELQISSLQPIAYTVTDINRPF